jgi:hypothetical protein
LSATVVEEWRARAPDRGGWAARDFEPVDFEKAIGHGDDYDALIAEAEARWTRSGRAVEDLAVRDIQEGADT